MWWPGSKDGAGDNYQPPAVDNQRMAILTDAVRHSPDASEFTKRLLLWMIQQTNNLTCRVALSVDDDMFKVAATSILGEVHGMASCGGRTHIGRVFKELGTEVGISFHGGRLVSGYLDTNARDWITLWISFLWYDKGARLLVLPPFVELSSI